MRAQTSLFGTDPSLPEGFVHRLEVLAEPRSAYLLRGPSRTEWEHSIPPVDELRYSVTFRTPRPG